MFLVVSSSQQLLRYLDLKVFSLSSEVSLKVPKNTKNGQKFRLKGKGVPDRKTGLKGDLYLVANVVLPDVDSLDSELRSMLESKLKKEAKL